MATHQKAHTKNRGTKELIMKEKNEDYAEILRATGDARFECQLLNGEKVMAKLVGRLIKGPNKQRIIAGDFVLIQVDPSSDKDKFYVIHKYTPEDKKRLAKNGELTQITTNKEATTIVMEGDVIDHTAADDDEDIDDLIDNI